MRVEAYVNFGGRCQEAVEFYRKSLDAQVQMLMHFKDSPAPADPKMVPPGWENKVMHCSFRVGQSVINASDGESTEAPKFAGISLTLWVESKQEAERRFAALAEGGQVRMPLTQTFFSPSYGMLADRFGVNWMVITASDGASA